VKSDEVVERIREDVNIVDIISDYVALQQRGKNLVGLCPFHDERTPSFSVSPDRQLYYCFGCHAGGDVFSFVMEMEGVSFPEAINMLAERAGIDLPKRKGKKFGQPSRKRKVQNYLYKLGEFATKFFSKQLENQKGRNKAVKYLRGRGISEDIQKEYRLGYAPDSWDTLVDLLKNKGVKMKAAELLGLVKYSEKTGNYYDAFRDRLIFPISDFRGKVVGFAGRVLGDGHPKYLNSPENPIFHKGDIWYGLDKAKSEIRRRNRTIIVEGYIDVLACVIHGWRETVASMGTAITQRQAKVLSRYTDEAYIAYDADEAGLDAVTRSIPSFVEGGINLHVVELPGDMDPDDLLSSDDGQEKFAECLETAQSSFEFCWQQAAKKYDLKQSEGKSKALREVADMILREEDSLVRADRIRTVAERLSVPEDAVRKQLNEWNRMDNRHKQSINRHNTKENYGTESLEQKSAAWHAEREILRIVLQTDDYAQKAFEELTEADFENKVHRRLLRSIFKSVESGEELLLDSILKDCDKDERRLAARLTMEEMPPAAVDKVFRDCVRVLRRRSKEKRVQQLRDIISQKESEGESVPSEILKEQMELLTDLKKSRV